MGQAARVKLINIYN